MSHAKVKFYSTGDEELKKINTDLKHENETLKHEFESMQNKLMENKSKAKINEEQLLKAQSEINILNKSSETLKTSNTELKNILVSF